MNGRKKLIEVFGDYWHRGESGSSRVRHFAEFGFDTLIVWERECKNESLLESKLLAFHER